jgi:hypothetical protein
MASKRFRPLKVVVRLEDILRRLAAAEVIEQEILIKVCPWGTFRPGEVFDIERMLKWILDRLPTLSNSHYDLVISSQDNDRICQLLGDDPLGIEEQSRRSIALAVILYLQGKANETPQVAGELRKSRTYDFGGHARRDIDRLPLGRMKADDVRQFGELVELWLIRETRVVLVYFRDEHGRIQHYDKPLLTDPADSHMEAARYLFRRYLNVDLWPMSRSGTSPPDSYRIAPARHLLLKQFRQSRRPSVGGFS